MTVLCAKLWFVVVCQALVFLDGDVKIIHKGWACASQPFTVLAVSKWFFYVLMPRVLWYWSCDFFRLWFLLTGRLIYENENLSAKSCCLKMTNLCISCPTKRLLVAPTWGLPGTLPKSPPSPPRLSISWGSLPSSDLSVFSRGSNSKLILQKNYTEINVLPLIFSCQTLPGFLSTQTKQTGSIEGWRHYKMPKVCCQLRLIQSPGRMPTRQLPCRRLWVECWARTWVPSMMMESFLCLPVWGAFLRSSSLLCFLSSRTDKSMGNGGPGLTEYSATKGRVGD